MKYNQILLSGFLLLLSPFSFAQADSTHQNLKDEKIHYTTLVQGGVMEGEKATSLQLQLINGIVYRTWQVGVGTGLDYYFVRSIPLFLDVRKYTGYHKLPLFGYGDAGINFPWAKEEDGLGQEWNTFKNGFYYDLGIGYKFASKKRTGLVLSAGYSEKKITIIDKQVSPCFYPPCPENKFTYKYELRRISIKAGLRF